MVIYLTIYFTTNTVMASENDVKKMFASPIVEFIFGKDTIAKR